jgi:hypothetical protein
MEGYDEQHAFGGVRVVWPSFCLWPRRLAELLGFPKAAAAIAELEVNEHKKRQQAEAEFKLPIAELALLRRDGQ